MKKTIKTLQKTISWHKKTKATLQKKIQRLEAENRPLLASQPSVSTAALDEAYMNEDNEQEYLDDDTSMVYSFLEESEYVIAVKNILFSTTEEDLSKTVEKYRKKALDPLCKQFTDRRSKEDAIKQYRDRKALDGQALFPSLEEQMQKQSDLIAQQEANAISQQSQPIRSCKECNGDI
ncbi:Hypothetical predicted protein [Paramuricea clavata]|uniref:Uncharacterized protein n=1 Tax=Paramuricea clavata TaxID=317549 RepID=A0A6S7FSL4_PARCT|nr:Hypothetical predicted protein [Paramuricea clavata]